MSSLACVAGGIWGASACVWGPHAFVFAGGNREGFARSLSLASPAQAYALAPQIPPATQAMSSHDMYMAVVHMSAASYLMVY